MLEKGASRIPHLLRSASDTILGGINLGYRSRLALKRLEAAQAVEGARLEVERLEEVKGMVLDRALESGKPDAETTTETSQIKGAVRGKQIALNGVTVYGDFSIGHGMTDSILESCNNHGFGTVQRWYGVKDPSFSRAPGKRITWKVEGKVDDSPLTPEDAGEMWDRFYPALRLRNARDAKRQKGEEEAQRRSEEAKKRAAFREVYQPTADKVAEILDR